MANLKGRKNISNLTNKSKDQPHELSQQPCLLNLQFFYIFVCSSFSTESRFFFSGQSVAIALSRLNQPLPQEGILIGLNQLHRPRSGLGQPIIQIQVCDIIPVNSVDMKSNQLGKEGQGCGLLLKMVSSLLRKTLERYLIFLRRLKIVSGHIMTVREATLRTNTFC